VKGVTQNWPRGQFQARGVTVRQANEGAISGAFNSQAGKFEAEKSEKSRVYAEFPRDCRATHEFHEYPDVLDEKINESMTLQTHFRGLGKE